MKASFLAMVAALASVHAVAAVDFEKEILPIFKESCLACHNQTKAKADLVLETPQSILKGGESGPAAVPGQPDESLLLKLAEHRDKPVMPPKDNKVNAPDLTTAQLQLLRLWIAEGAKGEVRGAQQIVWQSLRETVRPILSLAVSDDGQFAACGRGNRLAVYQLPAPRTLPPLADPELRGEPSAHRDLVESVAFSPDGQWLASGSYREVKLWRRQEPALRAITNRPPGPALLELDSPDAKTKAVADGTSIRLVNLADGKTTRELRGDYGSSVRLAQLERQRARATNHLAYRKTQLAEADKQRAAQVERVRKASDAAGLAEKALADQTNQLTTARAEESGIQKELTAVTQRLKDEQARARKLQEELAGEKAAFKELNTNQLDHILELASKVAVATNALNNLKAETDKSEAASKQKLKAAQKKIADAEALLKRGQLTNATAENELTFAISTAQGAADQLVAAQNFLQTAETDLKQIETQCRAAQNAWTNSLAHAASLAYSGDGLLLASADDHARITIWSASSGAPLQTMAFAATNIWFEGDSLCAASTEKNAAFDLTPRWKLERTIALAAGQAAFADRVNALCFSPDGQNLATAGGEPSRGGEVKIWRVRDAQLVQEFKNLHSDAVLSLAYSPDGRYLATGSADRFAKITEIATGKLVRALEGHTHHVLALGWNSDGHTLVTAGADNLLKFWDAFSGEKKKSPEAAAREMTAAVYVDLSREVLAACADGSLRLERENGEKIRSFEGAKPYLQTAVVTSDHSRVLAGGQDGILRMWNFETGGLDFQFDQ